MKVYLDDERPAPDGWVQAYRIEDAIRLLMTGKVTHISLDNDLGADERGVPYPEGRFVADWIERMVRDYEFEPPEIEVHSMNPVAAQRMRMVLENIQRFHEENLTRRQTAQE